MFGSFKQRKINSRPRHVRARDGYIRATSSQRRRRRKASGLSARQQRSVIKARRAYKNYGEIR